MSAERPVGERLGAGFVVLVTGLVAVALLLAAFRNVRSGDALLALTGLGMLVLVAVGVVLVVREVRLGLDSGRLARHLEDEGALPVDPPGVQRRRSGRLSDADAQVLFVLRRAEVEAAPQEWRAWFALALAYGDAGDTSQGRHAMRTATRLHRSAGTSPSGRRAAPS